MNIENTCYLIASYPKLYKQYNLPPEETCMCWGFECGDGWFNIINELSDKIEALNNTPEFEETPIEAVQVKEKYGSLRFYVDWVTPENVYDWIEETEKASETICEACGKNGKIKRIHGWLKCICEDCENGN